MVNRETRSFRRIERYQIAIDLGFSAREARILRDVSGDEFQERINTERRRIARKSTARRSESESKKLTQIREFNRQDPGTISRRLDSRGSRYDNFRIWSSFRVGFPDWAEDFIFAQNDRAGRDRFDGFGYRAFYYYYVEKISDVGIVQELADRGDSGVVGVQQKISAALRESAA